MSQPGKQIRISEQENKIRGYLIKYGRIFQGSQELNIEIRQILNDFFFTVDRLEPKVFTGQPAVFKIHNHNFSTVKCWLNQAVKDLCKTLQKLKRYEMKNYGVFQHN